jgi:hypothetical protein
LVDLLQRCQPYGLGLAVVPESLVYGSYAFF